MPFTRMRERGSNHGKAWRREQYKPTARSYNAAGAAFRQSEKEKNLSLDTILAEINLSLNTTPSFNDARCLRALIALIRPQRPDDVQRATDNLRVLCYVLQQNSVWRKSLRQYLVQVITTRKLVHLLTDTGITLNNGFWGAGAQRLFAKLLPPLVNDDYVRDIFGQIFDQSPTAHREAETAKAHRG